MDVAKIDITNLAGLYGAIVLDRQSRPAPGVEDEHPLTPPLPEFRDREAVWANNFLKSAGPLEIWEADPNGTPLDFARAALRAMSKTKPHCRMQARRMVWVGAAARRFRELEPDELAAAALGRRDLQSLEAPDAHAKLLAEALRQMPDIEDSATAHDAWWETMRGAVPYLSLGHRPCAAGLRMMRVRGDEDPVPTVRTEVYARMSFDAAFRFCEPLNWICFPSWCAMKKVGNLRDDGVQKYREVVSFDCIGKSAPVLTVDLDVKGRVDDGPQRVAKVEYRLSAVQPEDDVLVNEGWLEVVELSPEPDPWVRVTTSKTIKFSPEYVGPGLVFMCHMGYLTLVEDLICCASKAPDEEVEGYPDIPFPGATPPGQDTQKSPEPGDPKYGGLIKVMIDQAAGALDECIDEFAEAATRSYDKIEAKEYYADDLVQDVADGWLRMLNKGASVADAGLDAIRTAAPGEDRPAARARRHTQGEQ